MRRSRSLLISLISTSCLLLLAACGEDLPRLSAEQRFEIRPTDGTGWNGNGYPSTVTVKHWDSPGGRFRVHYTEQGKHAVPAADVDSDKVPDFVESFGKTFDEVYAAEVVKLGFRPPLDDSKYHDRPDYGGDARFDVYLLDQGASADGYVVVEACKTQFPYQCAGYMVVENDFKGYSYKTPEEGMKVLASHEFFHVLQNAYRYNLPKTFTEATAVWATEQVFPEVDDFERFIKYFFKEPHRSLDHALGTPVDAFPYGLGIWPAFLAEKHGPKVIPAIFEEVSDKGTSTNDLVAIHKVLARDHKSSLAEAFGTFALWNYFTGDRSKGFSGYKAAATYPQVALTPVTGALPLRISGQIAYLSARYYLLNVKKGQWIQVDVERPQPKLAMHLITRDGIQTKIESIMPDKTSAKIESGGAVAIVAASTALKDSFLPLSLAVREIADPSPTKPDAGVPDGGATDPGDGESGCSVGDGSRQAWPAALLALLPLVLLRRRGPRGALWRAAPILALAALLAGPLACSDSEPAADAGVDTIADSTTSVDAVDAGGDLATDGGGPLAVGQYREFLPGAGGTITGSEPVTGKEEFLLLLLSEDPTALKNHDYSAARLTKTDGRLPGDEAAPAPPGAGIERCGFHRRLEDLFREKPTSLKHDPGYLFCATPPVVGDKRQFQIRSGTTYVTITAEAKLVDSTAAYWIDTTTTPLASIPAATLKELADGFSKIIVPRERIYFGKESDVDSDGLISVLFSPLVPPAIAYVRPCDLVDTTTVPGCKVSNKMELIYVTPPSALKPPMNTAKAMLETVAHEFQHAIYFYRKYVLNNITSLNENPYVTEGLSALAQDLSGYQAGNLYVVLAALGGIDVISVPNLTNKAIGSYVPKPNDGYMRGGGYLLLRYLFDLAGGDDMDSAGTPQDKGGIKWLRAFVDSKDIGDANFTKSTGLTMPELIRQFWTAMALSNRGPGGGPISKDPKENFLPITSDPLTKSVRGCDLFVKFHASAMTGPKTQDFDKADGKLRGGGAEFLTLSAKAGSTSLGFEIKTKPEARARVRLIRLK